MEQHGIGLAKSLTVEDGADHSALLLVAAPLSPSLNARTKATRPTPSPHLLGGPTVAAPDLGLFTQTHRYVLAGGCLQAYGGEARSMLPPWLGRAFMWLAGPVSFPRSYEPSPSWGSRLRAPLCQWWPRSAHTSKWSVSG